MLIVAGVLLVSLAGCGTEGTWLTVFNPPTTTEPPTATVEQPADVQYYPSDEPLRLGLEHFNRGHYGIAERYFRDAVEKAPRDVTAWVGLAATYDRIGRFDLADRAYRAAFRLGGNTIELLNNQGYSYMLRGDYPAAQAELFDANRLGAWKDRLRPPTVAIPVRTGEGAQLMRVGITLGDTD